MAEENFVEDEFEIEPEVIVALTRSWLEQHCSRESLTYLEKEVNWEEAVFMCIRNQAIIEAIKRALEEQKVDAYLKELDNIAQMED